MRRTVSSDNSPKRVTNSYDVEEVRPQPPDLDRTVSEPGQSHAGETTTEGLDKMMDDLSGLSDRGARDEPVSASERNLEYDRDWLGVQLTKLNQLNLARRAFQGRMDRTEIEEVALELIYDNQYDPALNLKPPEPGAVELEPAPVDEQVVTECREAVSAD